MMPDLSILTFLVLNIVFQFKHFFADYIFQNNYMLGKFKPYPDFILPLAAHSAVQALGTLAICLIFSPHLWWLSLVDFVSHFIIDRIKADKKLLGRWAPTQSTFWTMLGLDQLCHHLVSIVFAYLMVQ